MGNFWLFQANPYYDLSKKVPLLGSKGDTWSGVKNFKQMKSGDRVVLWQNGAEAGVYAFGKLTSDPQLYRGRQRRPGERCVDIEYGQLLKQPVFRPDLQKHSILGKMAIFDKMAKNVALPVTEGQWHALKKLVASDTLNIFTHYTQKENRFTNGLVALLEMSRYDGSSLAKSFLRDLLSLELKHGIRNYRVLRRIDGTADAELRGADYCIRVETKITSGTLRPKQIGEHLKRLSFARTSHKMLVLLTPDDSNSNYVKSVLASKSVKQFRAKWKSNCKVRHLEWKAVYKYLESHIHKRGPLFSHIIGQFLTQIHDCIFEQDYAGIIQKIAFGDETEVYAKTTSEHWGYLDEMKRQEWSRWNTPQKYEKLDGKGRKLLLYDPFRKEITVEVEIAKVEEHKEPGTFHCRNSFVPGTLKIYRNPIPLSCINAIAGLENFTRGPGAKWNITREQYSRLLGLE